MDVINTLHSLDPEKSEVFDFALNPKDTSSFFTVGSDQCLLKLSVGKKEQIHLEVMEKHQTSSYMQQ